jgi:hypothetical protein
MAIIQQVLRERLAPHKSSINYFAKERRDHRILV